MDVLSDVIAAMRIGVPHSSRTHRTAPWQDHFEAAPGAGFHIVLAGSCVLTPDDGPPLMLHVGDVAFLAHGRGHALSSAPGEPETVLLCGAYQLDPGRTHPLLQGLPEILHLPARLGHDAAVRATVDLLASELERELPGSSSTVIALLDVLLLLILRTWLDESTQPATGWSAALRDPGIAAVLRAMHEDLAHPWTIPELAALAGMSRATLTRRFTTLIDRPPLTYLTWWRLTTAARLLRDTDATLAVIAQQVGYASEYAFAAAFKRRHGLAPGRYRAPSAPLADTDVSLQNQAN
ncbi:AraC family transcriptional regulator [Nocardia sp. NPDC050712]|uniref:AraC family transcriptional regulator n=1 Tax=Nocardia sp. NPDC050712 TaxID=3155518 RepID=UPI003405F544